MCSTVVEKKNAIKAGFISGKPKLSLVFEPLDTNREMQKAVQRVKMHFRMYSITANNNRRMGVSVLKGGGGWCSPVAGDRKPQGHQTEELHRPR